MLKQSHNIIYLLIYFFFLSFFLCLFVSFFLYAVVPVASYLTPDCVDATSGCMTTLTMELFNSENFCGYVYATLRTISVSFFLLYSLSLPVLVSLPTSVICSPFSLCLCLSVSLSTWHFFFLVFSFYFFIWKGRGLFLPVSRSLQTN